MVLYTLALAGLYALLGRRSALGLSGLLLAGLAFLAALSPIVYFLYHLLWTRSPTVPSPDLIFPGQTVDAVGDALLGGAVLLLAVAALVSGALGRWAPLPFVLALLILLPVFPYLGFAMEWMPYPVFWALSVLRGMCWVLIGVALWRRVSVRDRRATGTVSAGPA